MSTALSLYVKIILIIIKKFGSLSIVGVKNIVIKSSS